MAQQQEKMLMNFTTTDFQRLYSQYQTRQKNRLDCFKKLERAYPELAKVAEATHANVKYDLPTAPLCVGNTLQHIVSNMGHVEIPIYQRYPSLTRKPFLMSRNHQLFTEFILGN